MKPNRNNLAGTYMWFVIAAGAASCAYAALQFQAHIIDRYFLLLVISTILIGSRVAIRIHKLNTNITVEDTFVFIALLLYGGPTAILLGAVTGVCSALRISSRFRTVAFASASIAVALTVTSVALRVIFGSTTNLFHHSGSTAMIALCVMGMVQYLTHTAIGAAASALKHNESIWQMWTKNFLWISISYFAGAAGAGLVVGSVGTARFWALLVALPVIVIVYFSYDRYMHEVKASARVAEEAERARAESEHERAEQAERHVLELNNYIAEQERISRVLEETKEHFRHAAFHDSLTGLPNRAMFTQLLQAEIESTKRRSDHLFSVLFLDLDRFKNINDSLGHTHGALLLVAFA